MVAPEGLLFLTLLFHFERAEEFILGATVGVAFTAAAMASLTVEVLMPVGVDMVVLGGVVVCCVQLFKLGCGNFPSAKQLGQYGGFWRGQRGDVALIWVTSGLG